MIYTITFTQFIFQSTPTYLISEYFPMSWAGPHGIGSHDGEGNSGQGEERSDCSCWGAFAELVLFPRGPVVLWADPLC